MKWTPEEARALRSKSLGLLLLQCSAVNEKPIGSDGIVIFVVVLLEDQEIGDV